MRMRLWILFERQGGNWEHNRCCMHTGLYSVYKHPGTYIHNTFFLGFSFRAAFAYFSLLVGAILLFIMIILSLSWVDIVCIDCAAVYTATHTHNTGDSSCADYDPDIDYINVRCRLSFWLLMADNELRLQGIRRRFIPCSGPPPASSHKGNTITPTR